MSSEQWIQEETYKTLSFYANQAIKTVLLLNGGAVLSILTFLGNLLKNSDQHFDMSLSISFFLIGIILGTLGSVFAYFTQLSVFNNRTIKSNKINIWITKIQYSYWLNFLIICIFISVLCFCIGSYCALLELQTLARTN